jgi:hypothetical protein
MLNILVTGNLYVVGLATFRYKAFSVHIVGSIWVETILIWRANNGELISIFVCWNWDIDFPIEELIQNVVWVILEVNEISLACYYTLYFILGV